MQSEELPLSGYDFDFAEEPENTYVFRSSRGYLYKVLFKPSGYLFPETSFSGDVFEFVIALTNSSDGRLPLADPLIEPTIVKIFQDFFARRGVVAVYICDSSDNRQAVRSRMFNRWYERYRGLGFVKMDGALLDPFGIIYTSIIVHQSYAHKEQVLSAFLTLTDEINAGK